MGSKSQVLPALMLAKAIPHHMPVESYQNLIPKSLLPL